MCEAEPHRSLCSLGQDEVLKRREGWSMRSLASSCSAPCHLSFSAWEDGSQPSISCGQSGSLLSHQSLSHLGPTMLNDMQAPCLQTPSWIVPQGLSVSPQILRPEEIAHPNSALIPKKKWIQFLQKWNGMKIGYREGRTIVIRVLQELTIKCSVWALIRVWFEQINGLCRQSGKFKDGIHVRWH